jgi:hypothetical protein
MMPAAVCIFIGPLISINLRKTRNLPEAEGIMSTVTCNVGQGNLHNEQVGHWVAYV